MKKSYTEKQIIGFLPDDEVLRSLHFPLHAIASPRSTSAAFARMDLLGLGSLLRRGRQNC